MNILRTAIEAGESEVAALCDVDRRHLDNAASEVDKLTAGDGVPSDQFGNSVSLRDGLARDDVEIGGRRLEPGNACRQHGKPGNAEHSHQR